MSITASVAHRRANDGRSIDTAWVWIRDYAYGLHAEVHDGHHAGREARRDAVLSEVPRDLEDIALSLQHRKHIICTRAGGGGGEGETFALQTLLETLLLLKNVCSTLIPSSAGGGHREQTFIYLFSTFFLLKNVVFLQIPPSKRRQPKQRNPSKIKQFADINRRQVTW